MSTAIHPPDISHTLASAMSVTREQRVGIGHALVDNFSFEQAQAAIIEHAQGGGPTACVLTPNAQHVVLLGEDSRLRDIYRRAE